MSEIILNEPRISALVGQGEAASVAQHVGMSEQGQGSGCCCSYQEQVDGAIGATRLRCSLTKNALPAGFIRARSLSHALMGPELVAA